MHLQIRHEITCRFEQPARNLVSILRLSPRSHEGQHVSDWWIDSDIDCSLKTGGDEFGNVTQTFSATGPLSAITIAAAGSVDTFDTAGMARGTAERMPVEVFLRDTPLTMADAGLKALAAEVGASEPEPLGKLHSLMDRIHLNLTVDTSLPVASAAEAFASATGSAQSLAHVFIAAARHLGVPSRAVCGYLVDGTARQATCHAWAEAYVPSLGWIGFDAAENLCPQGAHVRVAAGFDALGAAFIRGTDPARTRHAVRIKGV